MTVQVILILAAASYRVYRLLAIDEILADLRGRLMFPIDGDGDVRCRERLEAFIGCPWCLGFWISIAWTIAYAIDDRALWAAAPFAVSLLVGLASRLDP